MHRLVAHAIRDRLEATGELRPLIAQIANGLEHHLIPVEQAWTERHAAVEIVSQVIALWDNAVIATQRGALEAKHLQAYVLLAHWAVNHLRATADLSRAIATGRSVCDACEQILGSNHPDTLTSRNDLARAYREAGDLDRAIPLLEDTLEARKRVLGDDHADTLITRSNLAFAYQQAGNLDRAIPLFEEVVAARERMLPSRHADTLTARNSLGIAYREARDLDRAIPRLRTLSRPAGAFLVTIIRTR